MSITLQQIAANPVQYNRADLRALLPTESGFTTATAGSADRADVTHGDALYAEVSPLGRYPAPPSSYVTFYQAGKNSKVAAQVASLPGGIDETGRPLPNILLAQFRSHPHEVYVYKGDSVQVQKDVDMSEEYPSHDLPDKPGWHHSGFSLYQNPSLGMGVKLADLSWVNGQVRHLEQTVCPGRSGNTSFLNWSLFGSSPFVRTYKYEAGNVTVEAPDAKTRQVRELTGGIGEIKGQAAAFVPELKPSAVPFVLDPKWLSAT